MRNYLALFISILLISCQKEEITPGNYHLGQQTIDTTTWKYVYNNGGVVPSWGNTSDSNELIGTRWVLTYLQIGFSTPPLPPDTLNFISVSKYTINDGSERPYQLSNNVATNSKTLTLYFHYPFGSGNYAGQVASTFVSDGVILNCEFKNINTPTTVVRASFSKI